MKKIVLISAIFIGVISIYGNPPICSSKEYAKYECSTVFINGKPVTECRWVCKPLSSAGR